MIGIKCICVGSLWRASFPTPSVFNVAPELRAECVLVSGPESLTDPSASPFRSSGQSSTADRRVVLLVSLLDLTVAELKC